MDISTQSLDNKNQTNTNIDKDISHYKTLILFIVDHNNPSILVESLAVFKPYKFNLISINARLSGIVP